MNKKKKRPNKGKPSVRAAPASIANPMASSLAIMGPATPPDQVGVAADMQGKADTEPYPAAVAINPTFWWATQEGSRRSSGGKRSRENKEMDLMFELTESESDHRVPDQDVESQGMRQK